ncbi:MAG: N-acetylmuramoyl-L-alanine amidase [uncultured bacterium (gcode 4)]|uniref:N-acetylmuramoyl-L-alanine amidase n=1 Tax=uncultured bacterium (gcode 4) TaxID=1234023 RepID=K2AXX3_9BACT|nr:MAG: N-acetylmuramoyl-L-alanine amidase [uncultured bacterium (gcode 4)]
MNEMGCINKIIIHHTERNNDSPSFVTLRHKYLRRWEDIWYHYIIGNTRPFSKNGKVYHGRSEYFEWAHTIWHNKDSLWICLIGNFNKVIPSEEQLESLFKLLKDKIKKYQLTVNDILWHNEVFGTTKTCPWKFTDMAYIRWILRQDYSFCINDYIERVLEKNNPVWSIVRTFIWQK